MGFACDTLGLKDPINYLRRSFMEYTGKWIDGHIHIEDEEGIDLSVLNQAMEDIRRVSRMEAYALQSIPSWDEEHVLQNPLCILQKALYPDTTYYFGGLDYYVYKPEERDFRQQLETLLSVGADGFKIIETKPMVGKQIGLSSLTAPEYSGFFALLEEKRVPVMWHVGDPETFWDKDKAPEWAAPSGWFYGDGTFPSKESLYSDVEEILRRYPGLSVTFAHMLFLAYDLERLDRMLEKYPNIRVDLTPGCEMYGGFALRQEDWRQFFIKYQDRVLLGTDGGLVKCRGTQAKIDHAAGHAERIRKFLSTDEEIYFDDYGVRGVSLPDEICEKILYSNFIKAVGEKPKKISIPEACEYLDRLAGHIEDEGYLKRLGEIKGKLLLLKS